MKKGVSKKPNDLFFKQILDLTSKMTEVSENTDEIKDQEKLSQNRRFTEFRPKFYIGAKFSWSWILLVFYLHFDHF